MAEDQTITDAPVEDGAQEALPTETEEQTAATEETSQEEQSEGEQSSLPETDEKLKNYAESHGIDLDSPGAIKAAKIAMDNQADFSRGRAGAKLKESLDPAIEEHARQQAEQTGGDPEVLRRVAATEVRLAVRDFFDSNPEAKQYEQAMVDTLQNKPHLAGDLDALYAVARAKSPETLKSQGAKDALQSLASKQHAAMPNGSAVNPAPKTQPVDNFAKGFNSDD
jgi:hypothetical protein